MSSPSSPSPLRSPDEEPVQVDTGALYAAALSAHRRGLLDEAETAYLELLSVDDTHADAWHFLGVLYLQKGRLAEAENRICKALSLREDAFFLGNLGIVFQNSLRGPEAEAAYRRSIELKPDHADAHLNLGNLLRAQKRLGEAEEAYRRVLTLAPDHVETHNNFGLLLKDRKRLAEAEASYRRVLALKPDHVEAHYNLANLLMFRGQLDDAETCYRRALQIKPDDTNARINLGLFLLTTRRYEEGWRLHESRHAAGRSGFLAAMPFAAHPQWQGEPLGGKSFLLLPEQGFGDYIQFIRYVALLRQKGLSRLTVVCQPPLKELLKTVRGVDAVITDAAHAGPHDYWCFVMSLPMHFGTTQETIPLTPWPYLHALPERIARWQGHLPDGGLKVGLVWKGSPLHKNDVNRSLPHLGSLAPLWSVPGVAFVSLQKGQGEREAAQPSAGQPLVALGGQMHDFADTAAIVSQLDLVICVDTAVAHVAGALGKPCWILLPAMASDWRWQLNRTDSPWYPGVRLFRQSDLHDWGHTVSEVATALRQWVSMRSTSAKEVKMASPA